jgi:hypothetical protein
MLTGAPHPLANSATAALIRVTPDDHPHLQGEMEGEMVTLRGNGDAVRFPLIRMEVCP